MSLTETIQTKLNEITKDNEEKCKKFKKRTLDRISNNLLKKKQNVEDQEGLILKYQTAKPRGFTAIQQAFAGALNAN